jgi:uncharacterized protein DUF2875
MSVLRAVRGHRPRLKPYAWTTLAIVLAWVGFVGVVSYTHHPEAMSDWELAEMTYVMRWGVGAALALMAGIFGLHWAGKAGVAALRLPPATPLPGTSAPLTPEQQAVAQRTFALEIRAVGVVVGRNSQTELNRLMDEKANNFASVFSQDPKDYSGGADTRRHHATQRFGIGFRDAASDAVAYWPLPAFMVGPPKQPEDSGAAGNISSGRNAATLGVNLFLWQDDANTTSAQGTIERLFQFFDEHPEVPAALVFSEDGDVARDGRRVAGTDSAIRDGHYLPTILDSMAGLLVTRTDRVDRYLRPFAVEIKEDNQDTRTDLGKLWRFFWIKRDEFDTAYEVRERAKPGLERAMAPGAMASAWWHSQLPELWRTIDNRGPGHFTPTPWLPIRWTTFQLKEFDDAPLLGYLHRPIKVPLANEEGKPLKRALQVKALQVGWQQALQTLPDATATPARVFYDSHGDIDGSIALRLALHGLNSDGHGLDLGEVEEGFDIGKRLGATGVSSAVVELGLATMASYHDGGASASVYRGSDGSMTVQMVTPPDDAAKAANANRRGKDPFMYRIPN